MHEIDKLKVFYEVFFTKNYVNFFTTANKRIRLNIECSLSKIMKNLKCRLGRYIHSVFEFLRHFEFVKDDAKVKRTRKERIC